MSVKGISISPICILNCINQICKTLPTYFLFLDQLGCCLCLSILLRVWESLNQVSSKSKNDCPSHSTFSPISINFRPNLTSCAVLHVNLYGLTLISKPEKDCPSHFAFSPVSIVFDQFLTSFLTSLARMYEQSLINRYYALTIPPWVSTPNFKVLSWGVQNLCFFQS